MGWISRREETNTESNNLSSFLHFKIEFGWKEWVNITCSDRKEKELISIHPTPTIWMQESRGFYRILSRITKHVNLHVKINNKDIN